MLGRLLALVAGAALAVGASQGPAFTDQYVQNLTGRVAELKPLVEEFDNKVGEYGYTRASAMAECQVAVGLLDALCSTYESAVARYELLSGHLAELNAANVWMKPLVLARTYQKDIARLFRLRARRADDAGGACLCGRGFLRRLAGADARFRDPRRPRRRRKKVRIARNARSLNQRFA